jgi:hypothetical protein|tara:strand:+ start:593 stop:847 length:255 start_codon:yes stop_codon:yes gene_type:complete
LAFPVGFSQFPFEGFAGGVAGQGVYEVHRLKKLEAAYLTAAMSYELGFSGRRVHVELDHCFDCRAPLLVWDTDHRGIGDGRVLE